MVCVSGGRVCEKNARLRIFGGSSSQIGLRNDHALPARRAMMKNHKQLALLHSERRAIALYRMRYLRIGSDTAPYFSISTSRDRPVAFTGHKFPAMLAPSHELSVSQTIFSHTACKPAG